MNQFNSWEIVGFSFIPKVSLELTLARFTLSKSTIGQSKLRARLLFASPSLANFNLPTARTEGHVIEHIKLAELDKRTSTVEVITTDGGSILIHSEKLAISEY